jgi:hypothetical protein
MVNWEPWLVNVAVPWLTVPPTGLAGAETLELSTVRPSSAYKWLRRAKEAVFFIKNFGLKVTQVVNL